MHSWCVISTTLVQADFLRLIPWRWQFVPFCVKHLGQSNAMPCFQGSAERSSFVTLKCQLEAFSLVLVEQFPCMSLFSKLLGPWAMPPRELYVTSWKKSVTQENCCDLRIFGLISVVGALREKQCVIFKYVSLMFHDGRAAAFTRCHCMGHTWLYVLRPLLCRRLGEIL